MLTAFGEESFHLKHEWDMSIYLSFDSKWVAYNGL